MSTGSPSAVAGGTVSIAGKFFAPHDPSDIRTSPAIVHMDTLDAPALATVSPNSAGTFSVTVTVPATTAAGDHVLIVTQNGINGAPAFGTPARTVLTVDPAPLPAPVVTVPAPTAALAPVTVPAALTAPAATVKKTLTKAQKIARCKSKFKPSSAKTKKGRKRIAARRSACIRSVS